MSEDLRITVTRTNADYMSAMWANMSSGRMPWIVAIYGIVMGGIFFFQTEEVVAAIIAAIVSALFMTGVFWFCVWLGARKQLASPGARDAITYNFTPELLSVETKLGRGETSWQVWKRAFETKGAIVIRHHLNLIHILPKRDMSPVSQQRLKHFLSGVLDGRVKWSQP